MKQKIELMIHKLNVRFLEFKEISPAELKELTETLLYLNMLQDIYAKKSSKKN